jgi:hypothetical protein
MSIFCEKVFHEFSHGAFECVSIYEVLHKTMIQMPIHCQRFPMYESYQISHHFPVYRLLSWGTATALVAVTRRQPVNIQDTDKT